MSTREIDKSGLKYIAFQGERQVIFGAVLFPVLGAARGRDRAGRAARVRLTKTQRNTKSDGTGWIRAQRSGSRKIWRVVGSPYGR